MPHRVPRDPRLTDEANRLIADELRDATGEDVELVEPPQDVARHAGDAPADGSGAGAAAARAPFAQSRFTVVVALCAAVVWGIAIATSSGSWVVLPIAVLAFVGLGLLVARVTLRTSTQVERPAPETMARLEREGVADPERALNEQLRAMDPEPGAEGRADEDQSAVSELLRPGDRARTGGAAERPAAAAQQQQAAWTPSSETSPPVQGSSSVVGKMPYALVFGLMLVTLLAPLLASDADMWVLPLTVWPLCALFFAMSWDYKRKGT